MFDQDFLADLPAPRDDEPPQLRSDIADELADHLHCAYRREVLRDGNDESARQRVLDRFGDPKKLACRLWWQAMWSRIMGQRLLAGLQWMVSLAAVTLAGAVFWQQMTILQEMRIARQEDAAQRQALTNTLRQLQAQTQKSSPNAMPSLPDNELPSPGIASPAAVTSFQSDREAPDEAAADPMPSPASGTKTPFALAVRLVSGTENGPPVTDADVTVSNSQHSIFSLHRRGIARTTDVPPAPDERAPGGLSPEKGVSGTYLCRQLPSDRYELRIDLPDGQYCTRSLAVREDKPQELTIVCPGPRKKVPLQITMSPLPAALRPVNFRMQCELRVGPLDMNGMKWQSPATPLPVATFDPQTGQPVRFEMGERTVEFTQESGQSPEDWSVFVPTGPLEYRLCAVLDSGAEFSEVYDWPKSSVGHMKTANHLVIPEQDHWHIELPTEFLAELTQVAQRVDGKKLPVDRSPSPLPSFDVRNADPAPRTIPTLTLKFVEETADGPPPRIASAQITDPSGGGELADYDGPPYDGRFYFKSLQPDRYELMAIKADGQRFTQSILIRDEKPREMMIICPGPRKKIPVLVTLPPLPADLQNSRLIVKCRMWVGPVVIDDRRWQPGAFTVQELTFDPRTGQTSQILNCSNSQIFDLKETPAEDRTVFLQTGPVHYRFEAVQVHDKPTVQPASWHWPKGDDDYLTGSIASADVQWKLELPKEFVALLRNHIDRKVIDASASQPAIPSPENPPAAEVATDQPLGDHCRLILKFTSETKDGAAPEGAMVQLVNEQGQRVSSATPRRGELPHVAPASADVSLVPSTSGLCIFENIEPGRYQLKVSFKDGRYLKEQLPLLRPGQERKEHVVCPAPVKKSTISMQFQPPEDFLDAHITVSHSLRAVPFQLDGRAWEIAPTYTNTLEFDPASGLLSKAGAISLAQDRPEDRIIIVPSGPYRLVTQIYLDKQLLEFGDALNRGWPPDTNGERNKSTHTAEPGDNKWDIKVPDEFWSKARKKIADLGAAKKF